MYATRGVQALRAQSHGQVAILSERMSNTRIIIIIFLVLHFALWLSPAIIAHRRHHPRRLAITLVSLLLGLFCPIAFPCLIWACWPRSRPADPSQPISAELAHPVPFDLPLPRQPQPSTSAEDSRRESLNPSDYYSDE
jgi:hypothetical protein